MANKNPALKVVVMMQLHADPRTFSEAVDIIRHILSSGQVVGILCTVLNEKAKSTLESAIEKVLDAYENENRQNSALEQKINGPQENKSKPMVHVDVWNNKGMDIGAFMWQVEKYAPILYANGGGGGGTGKTLVFKYHTKSNAEWRRGLLKGTADSDESVRSVIRLFEQKRTLGLVGGECSFIFKPGHRLLEKNNADILRYLEQCAFERFSVDAERRFVAGTIWWCRASILLELRRLLSVHQWRRIYQSAPEGYFTDARGGTCIHAMERFLGGFGARMLGFDVSCPEDPCNNSNNNAAIWPRNYAQQKQCAVERASSNRLMTFSDEASEYNASSSNAKNFVVAVAIVKDEPDLVEWAAYHLSNAVGFDRLVVYDNGSAVPVAETLKGFGNRVQVRNWPHGDQLTAYRDAIEKSTNRQPAQSFGKELVKSERIEWIAFFDADEFLALKKHPNIRSFLADYAAFDAVSLNWLMFDANGRIHRPAAADLFVTQAYTTRLAAPDRHVKTIVRPQRVIECGGVVHPHHVHVPRQSAATAARRNGAGEFVAVDTLQRRILSSPFNDRVGEHASGENRILCTDVACFHHYYLRSLEDWKSRVRRGQVDRRAKNVNLRTEEHFWNMENSQKADKIEDFYLASPRIASKISQTMLGAIV